MLNVYASNLVAPIILSILGAAIVITGGVLLYIFVFSRQRMKRQIRDIEKKFSYLDALLIGQDSQYIHRLEIISRSNLLYVEKHETFQKQFKEIYENDDKFTESMIKQLNALADNKQFKTLKGVIVETRKTVAAFEEKVNKLDSNLYALIKPEEDTRHAVLQLKETYRRLKRYFYANVSNIELVSGSFTKVFDKLDANFSTFENLVECAEYDEAQNMIPNVQKVIDAVDIALQQIPNLSLLVLNVIPEKIDALNKNIEETEKEGLPLYNIEYHTKHENWINSLEIIKDKLIALQTAGVSEELTAIQTEIDDVTNKLEQEKTDKNFFVQNVEDTYFKAIDLEKTFLKICSLLPSVERIYKLGEKQVNDIAELKETMNRLGENKRSLDNYVHSNTKQPFSVLRGKLDDLNETYEIAHKGIVDFKAYLDLIKSSVEEAFNLVFAYFYRCKQIEAMIREMNIDNIARSYVDKISYCYELINDIDILIKNQPIDVLTVNEKVEELKNTANVLFREIEEKSREMQLAESAVVYANRDRNHQVEVDRQLNNLETIFFEGDFDKVYRDATAIYHKNHVEDDANAK